MVTINDKLIKLYLVIIIGIVINCADIATAISSINELCFIQKLVYFSFKHGDFIFIFIIKSSTIGLKNTTPIVPAYVNWKLVLNKLYGFINNITIADIEMLFNVSLFLYTRNAVHINVAIITDLITEMLNPVIAIYINKISISIILLFLCPNMPWVLFSDR